MTEPSKGAMAAAEELRRKAASHFDFIDEEVLEICTAAWDRIIARHTRPRWTDERPTAEDVGCVASFEWAIGGEDHGKIVQDDEGVLWLRAAIGRSLWIHDPHLRGRWCVYPKPMEVENAND